MRFSIHTYARIIAGGLAAVLLFGGMSATADEFSRPSGGRTVVHQDGKVVRSARPAEAKTSSI